MTSSMFALTVDTVGVGERTRTTLRVRGEVDVINAAAFVEAIEEVDGTRPLIVDLSGLCYLDSSGFAALDELLARRTVTLVLARDSPIHTAAEIMGLPFHDTLETVALA